MTPRGNLKWHDKIWTRSSLIRLGYTRQNVYRFRGLVGSLLVDQTPVVSTDNNWHSPGISSTYMHMPHHRKYNDSTWSEQKDNKWKWLLGKSQHLFRPKIDIWCRSQIICSSGRYNSWKSNITYLIHFVNCSCVSWNNHSNIEIHVLAIANIAFSEYIYTYEYTFIM